MLYPIIREQVQKIRLHNGGIGFIYFVLRDQYSIKQLREWQQETGSVLYQMTLSQFLLCKRWSHGPIYPLPKPVLVTFIIPSLRCWDALFSSRNMRGWGRALDCSSSGPRFHSQHTYVGSQLPITLVPDDLMPSSASLDTDIHAGKHLHT